MLEFFSLFLEYPAFDNIAAICCKVSLDGKQYRYPYLSDIMYIEGEAHKATLHLVDGSQLSTIEKISLLKERLGDDCFLRCHQSYLVNMDYIADIQKDIIMEDGQIIPVSVRRRTETIAYYHKFFNTHYVEV